MKKYLLILVTIAATMFMGMSCTSSTSDDPTPIVNAPETKVLFNGAESTNLYTLARSNSFESLVYESAKCEPGFNIPTEKGYNTYFYIRIDGVVPGPEDNCAVNKYFPRDNTSKSPTTNLNHGFISGSEDIEWKSSAGLPKYIFTDPDGQGKNIEAIISDVPTIEELIAANTKKGDDFTKTLANVDKLHIIWYKAKKQSDGWHVDGILTTKERVSVFETDYKYDIIENNPDEDIIVPVMLPGEIEVDIHEQEHKDWNEIKTTVHIRDTVDVKVVLPIEEEYLAPADDFLIRTYEAYYKVGEYEYPIAVIATHNKDNITYEISGVTPEILKELRKNGDDGLTIEIHSYYINISHDELFEKIKHPIVTTSINKTTIYGQVHKINAPKEEWIPIGKGIKN